MIGDFFTKLLQGFKFKKFRDLILNIQGLMADPLLEVASRNRRSVLE
jgi:hypothetical protein